MKMAGFIVAGFFALTLAAAAQTNHAPISFRNPVRVFGPRSAINLAPLFQWWTHQPAPTNAAGYSAADLSTNATAEPDRPLTSWHLITGRHFANAGDSWAVEGVVYTSPSACTNARIILKHPPVLEEQTYAALKSRLTQATVEITNAMRARAAATDAEDRARAREDALRREGTKGARYAANRDKTLATQQKKIADDAGQQQKQLEVIRDETQRQLNLLPSRDGAYYVDLFAVQVGRNKQGWPIYDAGTLPGSPMQ